jgi:hypothetical protein
MATALDVAEALATVIPAKRQSGRGALDDVIRKQLNDQPTAARRTAVTDGKPPATETNSGEPATSTGLFRKLGADGLARLEVDNTKVAGPRARRSSEQVAVMPGDTDVHRLFEQSMDKDRHTEVGGPPTGNVPKDVELPEDEQPVTRLRATGSNKSITTDVGPPDTRRRATPWIVVGVLVAGAAGAGIYAMTRPGKTDEPIVEPPKDAATVTPPPATTGTVELFTTPAGATGSINGKQLDGPTPIRALDVPIGKAKVHLELEGYQPLDYDFDVKPGNNSVPLTFAVAPAKLHVITEPLGVSVALAGRSLGVTPLTRSDLSAVKDATLVLSKAGFETLSFKITLEAGKQLEVDKTLKAAQKFGVAQIRVVGGFGDVYLGGKKVGTAPTKSIRLPIGANKLHIVNPVAKIEWDLTCAVTEEGPNICETKQP